MKHIKDYTITKSTLYELPCEYIKEDYIGNNDVICQLEDGKILNDFDDFIKENNITNINENTYRFFLDSVFNATYKYIDNPYTYQVYQKKFISV